MDRLFQAALKARDMQIPRADGSGVLTPLPSRPTDGNTAIFRDEGLSADLQELINARRPTECETSARTKIVLLTLSAAMSVSLILWFTQSKQRTSLVGEALSDLEMSGDMGKMVGSYDAALDRIGERGEQIDDATRSMGVEPGSEREGSDSGLEAQLQEALGGGATLDREAQTKELIGEAQALRGFFQGTPSGISQRK